MKTPYALGLIFLFVLAIFLWEFPFSKTIDKDIPAIISAADKPYPYEMSESGKAEITYTNKPTVIHVTGKVSRKLFRQPEFDVQITADGFGWMTDGRHYMIGPLINDTQKGIHTGTVIYDLEGRHSATNSSGYMKTAAIFFDDDFKYIRLSTSTGEWMGDEEGRELLITGEARNQEEAEQVLRKIHEVYGDLMHETEL